MKSICFMSGKGGTGKSTVAASLAQVIADDGHKVLLFDADLGLSNLELILGIDVPTTLAHVVRDQRPLSDAVTVTAHGFDLIGGGTSANELFEISGSRTDQLITELFDIGSRYDFVLVDCGPGVGPLVKSVFEKCGSAVLVTTAGVTALTDAYAVMKWAEGIQPGKDMMLVLNDVANESHGEKVAKSLSSVFGQFLSREVRYLGCVRSDATVDQALGAGQFLMSAYPKSGAAQDLFDIGENLMSGGEAGGEEEGSFLDKLKARFGKGSRDSDAEDAA